MSRLLLLAGLAYGLLLVGLATLNGGLLALALPVILYLGAALIHAPDLPTLTVTRELSADRLQPGTTVDVKLTLRNESARLEEVMVEDIVPWPLELTEGLSEKIVVLPAGSSVELSYTARGPRGRYLFQDVRVTAADHLGLFRRQALLPAPGSFLALPEVRRMRGMAIRPLRTRASAGLIPARVGGPGVDFYGVRDYQAGDSLRWINWRATARTPRRIYTNEFEQERIADVGLILDARQRNDLKSDDPSSHGESLFEDAVRATASLADAFLRDGNRVAMLAYGAGLSWVFPGYGHVQRERILRALARVQTGESYVFETFDYLPTRLFPAGSQLVLVSPLRREDLPTLVRLRALGYELLVVSPDPITFEVGRETPAEEGLVLAHRIARLERKLLLRRLRQAGIPAVDWQVDKPLDQAVLTSLGRTPAAAARSARPLR